MFTVFTMSLALLALSGVLIDSHRRTWQAARQAADLAEPDRRFARSQYRRRLQASGIIGLAGAAIGIGPLVPRRPAPMACYLLALVAACGCIMLLALLDAWATRQHYRRLHVERLGEEVKLAMELRAAGESTEPKT